MLLRKSRNRSLSSFSGPARVGNSSGRQLVWSAGQRVGRRFREVKCCGCAHIAGVHRDVVDLRQVMGWPGLPLPGELVQCEWVCGEVWTREFLPGCVLVTLRPAERSIGLESEALLDGLPELGAEGLRALLAEEVARDEGDDI